MPGHFGALDESLAYPPGHRVTAEVPLHPVAAPESFRHVVSSLSNLAWDNPVVATGAPHGANFACVCEVHVMRVFTTPSGEHGNGLGVFLRSDAVPGSRRQAVARELGFAETVFVDDAERAEIRIHTPEIELPFAGHPSVGTAWLLRETSGEIAVLRPPAGDLRVRYEDDLTWIAARPEWSPPFTYVEYAVATDIDALAGAPQGEGWAYCWAWDDEQAGRVRARSFVTGAGIEEDEATGSAALALCDRLGRPIQIRQGQGSEIFARPLDDGFVEVGGQVALDEVRDYPARSPWRAAADLPSGLAPGEPSQLGGGCGPCVHRGQHRALRR